MKIVKIIVPFLIGALGICGFVFIVYKNFIIMPLQQSIAQKSGRVIILNGTSSVGKTPIARHL